MQKELKKMNAKELIPYENNPRINDAAVAKVKESIKQCGYIAPIVVDENNVVLAGHTRLKAIMQTGGGVIDVIVCSGLTEDQKKKYRILDNKTAEFAEWDFEKLEKELMGLDFDGFDFGFESADQADQKKEVKEDDYEPVLPAQPKSKPHQIYQLGCHRLMCGDSTSMEDVQKLCAGATIDLVLTDPPYGVDYEGSTGMKIANDAMEDAPFLEFLVKAFDAANSVLKPGGAFYIWHADSRGYIFREACKQVGWQIRQCLVWVKNSLVLGRQDYQWKHEPCLYGWKDGAGHYFTEERDHTTVIEEPLDFGKMKKEDMRALLEKIFSEEYPTTVIHEDKPKKNDMHPTMKPLKLLERQIKNSSEPGDKVLDIFGGSGSTMMTCEQLSRTAYIMEYDPKYVDAIIERWEAFTGEKAVLLNE